MIFTHNFYHIRYFRSWRNYKKNVYFIIKIPMEILIYMTFNVMTTINRTFKIRLPHIFSAFKTM